MNEHKRCLKCNTAIKSRRLCGKCYRDETREHRQEYAKKYYNDNKDYFIEYREKHADEIATYAAEYHRNNLEGKKLKDKLDYAVKNNIDGNPRSHMNRECSQYLGVHIAERVLSHVFDAVETMPNGNRYFDFICKRGKKIDVKSSTLHKDGTWAFHIKQNTVADYFLCIAFDNRIDLIPLHLWVLPGHAVNTKMGVSITKNTIDKWNIYRIDIKKTLGCCDMIRGDV